MKLKKVVEKTKQDRGERSYRMPRSTARFQPKSVKGVRPKESAGSDNGQANDLPRKVEQIETQKPIYRKSRSVSLNHPHLHKNHFITTDSELTDIESFKVIRTKIQQQAKLKGRNAFMVTSTLPGEGKTHFAVNMAITYARAYNQTVLLVDCDLRRQSIHKRLGFQSNLNLVDHLLDDVPMSDIIVWPGIEKLSIISGERTIDESTEVLSSAKMKNLVEEMKNRYADRVIFFDLPPLLSGADAMSFAAFADGIIVIVEARRTPMSELETAVGMIPEDKFLGFVLNKEKISKKKKYNYYGYYRKKATG
jgi:non-specific protein-tyrosine kinase